ncbi:MAG: GNAT family N-acetyltransferase [Turicibacter sp.]
MIIEVKEENLEDIVNYSWQIASDKTKSGFPRLNSYQDMYDRFLKAIKHREDKVLAYYHQNQLIGVLRLLVVKENNYLEALGGIYTHVDFKVVAPPFIQYIKENYKGFELDFGFPKEYSDAIIYLEEIKAKLCCASVVMELRVKDYVRSEARYQVSALKPKDYQAYKAFHDKYYPNFYWSSDRVLETLENWKIYNVIENEKIVGSIFIRLLGNQTAEIFGLAIEPNYKNTNLELELLSESLADIIQCGIEEVLFFVDEKALADYEASLKTGFKQIDTYRSYKLILY